MTGQHEPIVYEKQR